MPKEVGEELDILRFIFPLEDAGVYDLSEEAVEMMIDEAAMELDELE